jgi:hypothetical protein
MERRTFIGSSVAALGAPMSLAAEEVAEPREYFELRTYSLKASKQPMLDEYLSKAFIPAAKRYDAGPVGVFAEAPEKDDVRVFVLIVHKTAESAATLRTKLGTDLAFVATAGEFLSAKAADPVYHRIESSLLSAIAGMPMIVLPDPKRPRLFNLRIYESHNERAAATKIHMFENGEIEIFKKVGLTPVFFAPTVIGPAQPNLTYMLVFPDEAARKAAWDRFRVDPDWLKLKAIPEYADKEIVSKITNRILTPTTYSEI